MHTMCQVHFSQETDVLTVLIPSLFINRFAFTNFKVLSHGGFIHVDEELNTCEGSECRTDDQQV